MLVKLFQQLYFKIQELAILSRQIIEKNPDSKINFNMVFKY